MAIIVNNSKATALPTQLYAGSVGNNIPVVAYDSIATDFKATLTRDDFGNQIYAYTWTPLSSYLSNLRDSIIALLPKANAKLTTQCTSKDNVLTITCTSNNNDAPITYSIYNEYEHISFSADDTGTLIDNTLSITYYNNYYSLVNPSLNITFSQTAGGSYEAAEDKTIQWKLGKTLNEPKFSNIIIPDDLINRNKTFVVGVPDIISFEVIPTTDVTLEQLYNKTHLHKFRLVEYESNSFGALSGYIDYNTSDVWYNGNKISFLVNSLKTTPFNTPISVGIQLTDINYSSNTSIDESMMNSSKNPYWNVTIIDNPTVNNNNIRYYYYYSGINIDSIHTDEDISKIGVGPIYSKNDIKSIYIGETNKNGHSYFIYPKNFGVLTLSYENNDNLTTTQHDITNNYTTLTFTPTVTNKWYNVSYIS